MWMKCASTNNDPHIIAQYYLDTVKAINGISYEISYNIYKLITYLGLPKVVRADRGTENSIIAYVQPTLRSIHNDSLSAEMSFRYGRSSSNQVNTLNKT